MTGHFGIETPFRKDCDFTRHHQVPSSEQTDEVLEEVECPSCPGAGKIPLYELNSNGKRSIVRCADCSLIYVTPRIARDRIASTYSGQD